MLPLCWIFAAKRGTLLPMEYDKLLVKIETEGACPENELGEVVGFLDSIDVGDCEGAQLDATYAALTVVGKAREEKYLPVLEKFLEFHDALTCSKLLQILCDDWQLTKHYVENLIRFGVGVSWDDDDEVQQTSLRPSGRIHQRNPRRPRCEPTYRINHGPFDSNP